jgi:hypothetical protein
MNDDESELVVWLRAEVGRLRAAIREHKDRRGDDRCWLDDGKLYSVLDGGGSRDSSLPPKCEFLESCARFWEQRQHPEDKGRRAGEMTIAQLEAEVGRLGAELDRLMPGGLKWPEVRRYIEDAREAHRTYRPDGSCLHHESAGEVRRLRIEAATELERLRGRAERAERERNALIAAAVVETVRPLECLTSHRFRTVLRRGQYHHVAWFERREDAVSAHRAAAGLDAAS